MHNGKVYRPQGGDSLEVASGGAINIQSGGAVKFDGTDAVAQLQATAAGSGGTAYQTVAAAGANQAQATAVTADFVTVTGATDTAGVRLPAGTPGRRMIIKNTVTNKVLKVYPATGGKINALADDASLDMAAATIAEFIASSATQWYTLPLLPS